MNGVLVTDKPPGITSHDVVERVKRVLNVKKAGHTGTLDPLATGVLPVCINQATKIVQFLINDDKEYRATLRLGIETDTQDMTGKIIRESDRIPEDHGKIVDAFNAFTGNIKQKPPPFSALKYRGIPLYKWARRGIHVDTPERGITISKINIFRIDLPSVWFEVFCSKGTYIRTLCSDIGNRLGCGAHLVELRRTRSGIFCTGECHSLESIEDLAKKGIVEDMIIPMDRALINLPRIRVDENLARRIRHGSQILFRDLKDVSLSRYRAGQKIRINSFKDDLIAVAELLTDYPLTEDKRGGDMFCKLIRVFNA